MGLPGVEATPQTAPAIDLADRDSCNASLTLPFAQPGDTLLYLLLPLNHDGFGVSLAEAGLLLAANRLVRIAGYGWLLASMPIAGRMRRVSWRRSARCCLPWAMPRCLEYGHC
jgi:hypothetical protein